jgi:hypothetical protein
MKDTFNIHEWNLKRYLAEQQEQTIDLSQLTFDQITPLFPREMKYDGIAFPIGGDVLRRIKRENDFEEWKKDTMGKYGNIKIQLNPGGAWSSHIKILDDKFNKDKEQAIQSKSDSLDSMKGSKD